MYCATQKSPHLKVVTNLGEHHIYALNDHIVRFGLNTYRFTNLTGLLEHNSQNTKKC